MRHEEENALPSIQPGNFRNVCREPDCGWWREVPAVGVDRLIRDGIEHRATHRDDPTWRYRTPSHQGRGVVSPIRTRKTGQAHDDQPD